MQTTAISLTHTFFSLTNYFESHTMVSVSMSYEEHLDYSVSFREVHQIEREDVPPPGRFETTSSARLARQSRYRRRSTGAAVGIHRRGTNKAWR